MATGVNNSTKPVPSAASGTAASPAAAAPSVFMPPVDHSSGTWLSLGSYEELFNSDWDYWEVNKALNQGGMKLVKILKIHSHRLKERFDEETNLVKKGKNSGFDPNIQHLYHGTSENVERICHEGLDERLSTNGHFGRGIYFSDNPKFCRIHSEVKSSANPFIVRCKVILGDCKVYPPGSSDPGLTREPVKTSDGGKNVYYDSVQGKSGDFRQYVVYEKRRALIQYVIYYTTDGPIPSLPPIPPILSKSMKKKRPKSTERKRSTSPNNSDSRRHSGGSSGDERRRSVSSVDGFCSGRSSRANSVDGDDDDGAFCRRRPSVGDSEKNEVLPKPPADAVSEVPKVSTTRARTRRLLTTETSAGSADSSVPAPANADVSGSTAISLGAFGADAAALSNAAASAGAGPASLTSTDPSTDAYKKKVQENAMKQMLDLKGKLSSREMEELFHCFSQTYGGANTLNAQEQLLPNEASFSSGDDIQLITDVLVEQFQGFVGPVDPALARGYITQFDMDLERAVNAYFDSM